MILKYKNATLEDLPAIVSIYNSTIASRMVTADLEAVTVDSKVDWFNDHDCIQRPLWLILNEEDATVGWVSFQSFYGRPAYDTTVEISIYLSEEFRGKGVGKEILQHCIITAPSFGVKTLLGYIFAHNLPSLSLFKNCGFQEWGNLPNIANLDGVEKSLIILGKRVG